jgi:quinol monooxygenase YgiN
MLQKKGIKMKKPILWMSVLCAFVALSGRAEKNPMQDAIGKLQQLNYDGVVSIVGEMEIKDGKMEEFLKVFRNAKTKVAQEEGNLVSVHALSLENPNRISIYGEWNHKNSLIAHFQEPHVLAFFEASRDLIQGPPTLKFYRKFR